MSDHYYSHVSPKLASDQIDAKGGCGLFAVEPLKKGELILLWGGRVVRADEIDPKMPNLTQRVLQIDEGLYFLTPEQLEPADCMNHSCNPNAGFSGQIGLVAMRDIEAGEEVCIDYAMCDSEPYDEFECGCGAENCRGFISGDDWKIPALQARYDGYFSAYLQRRINVMKEEKVQAVA
jgi:SET domain-containing protein